MRLAAVLSLSLIGGLALSAGHSSAARPPDGASAESQSTAPPSRLVLDRHLDQILSRPEFRRAARAGGYDPRQMVRWLWLWVRRLFERLGGLHETNYGLFLAAVITGLAVLIPLLAHITYTLVRFFRARPARGPMGATPTAARLPGPQQLAREAEEAAARGEYRPAVRGLYLATVRHLQLQGLLPRGAAQTNWERLALLASRPALGAVVRPFTRLFDEKWYGGRAADAEDVAQCRAWWAAAQRETGEP